MTDGRKSLVGWIVYDFANSAFATTVLAVIFNQYFVNEIAGGKTGITFSLPFSQIHFEGAVLWNYLVALSTVFVAVSAPLLGAMADLASIRKKMLTWYCYFGVLATLALALVGPGDIWLAAVIFICANFGFAGANVFYNAFLVEISPRESYGKISGLAWGLGYVGGGLCLVLNLLMLKYPHLLGFAEGTFGVADCMIAAGLWWGVFALPTMFWLKEKTVATKKINIVELTSDGWRRLGNTLREIKKYRQLIRFLIAYLLFNDGIETVIIMASVFGAVVVGLQPGELVAFFILIQFSGFVGSLFFGWISDIIGRKTSLMISIGIWIGVVLWAYKIGWLMDIRTDFFIVGVLAGLVMGGSQTVARSIQAGFTPPSKSAEFFGFYAVSGRFASIFGPLIYGTAIWLTGGVQKGIVALVLFFIAGGIVLLFVDEKAGYITATEEHSLTI